MKSKIIVLVIIMMFIVNPPAASKLKNYYLQTSFYTHHYSQKNYQNNQQQLLGFERHYSNNKLNGISFFKNSYNQSTIYIYGGENYFLTNFKNTEITAKLTYGIVHGYDDENGKYNTWMHEMGTFPAIVLALGLRREPYRLEIIPFADAGIIITGGIEF